MALAVERAALLAEGPRLTEGFGDLVGLGVGEGLVVHEALQPVADRTDPVADGLGGVVALDRGGQGRNRHHGGGQQR